MDFTNVISLLGLYYPEAPLKQFLGGLELSTVPRIPRDSANTYLQRRDLGIELIFTDERYLDNPQREYPEGAVVLEQVRVYGIPRDDASPFVGTLPHQLRFGLTRQEISAVLGEPVWYDEELASAGWDLPDHTVFASFDSDGHADVIAFQTPVDRDL